MGDNSVVHGTPIRSPEEILAILKKEFPPELIQQKQGGRGKLLDYISGKDVEERLDEATGGVWSAELLWTERDVLIVNRQGNEVEREVIYSFIRLTIPGLGTRVGRGVQIKEPLAGEDVVKGAETDGLKVAAAKFGVGRYLYGGGPSSEASGGAQQSGSYGGNYGGGYSNSGGLNKQRQGDPPSESQWGKFNRMTQDMGIDPNAILRSATNGYDMTTVNKRGMSMTLDKLTRIQSGEERWDGAVTENSDMSNSGRFQQQAGAPVATSAVPTKPQLLGRIRGARTGQELDSIYDELVMLMLQDDADLMNALGERASQLRG